MSAKVDAVLQAARALVDSMTPEERLDPQQFDSFDKLSELVRAVEAVTLEPGEEIFSLCQSDPAAPATLRFWALRVEKLDTAGKSGPVIGEAQMTADRWEMWQLDHLVKVRVPA